MHAKRSQTHVKDPAIHVSLMDYGNTKITQHALKVSVFIMLKLDTIEEEKESSAAVCTLPSRFHTIETETSESNVC